MLTLKLRELLDEFEEWVVKGRAKKIPYQEWRWLKQHAEDQVQVERDGWGDLGIFSVTRCKFLVEGWSYDDGSLGTYLDNIYSHEFDKIYSHEFDKIVSSNCYSQWCGKYNNTGCYSEWRAEPVDVDSDINVNANGKENVEMNKLFKNFDFGSCENDNVKMSMYGIAVKNANGTWVSYDAKSGSVIDVDILNFDAKYLYKMPVAIKDVAPGDVVIHNRKPMFVIKIEDGKVLTIDPAAGEEKVILLTKSMFGFDFVTKVVNVFGDIAGSANVDAPFGNILPLMLLADGKSNDMLPLALAMGGGNFDISNPLMLYCLMGDGNNKDMLPFLFLMNNNTGCNCQKHWKPAELDADK